MAAAHRLTHIWSGVRREDVFPRGIWGAYKSLVAARPYIYTADALADLITSTMQARAFADLAVPFAAVATDMADGQATLLREGPLRPALLSRRQVVRDLPQVARERPVLYPPGPFPLCGLAVDFDHTEDLAASAYALSRRFLHAPPPGEGPLEPGLYGDPALAAQNSDVAAIGRL